jgi:diaminopimelate epimerase
MRMWNADGSEGRLCLNGLRCVAKLAAEAMAGIGDSFPVETAAGPRAVTVFRDGEGLVHEVEVDAGTPDFRRSSIPAEGEAEEIWGEQFETAIGPLPGHALSVGNPHVVLWMESPGSVREAALESIGPPLAEHPRFPEGVNVHLAAARDRERLLFRPWERGSGPTRACGTGAVAVFAVARRLGRVEPRGMVAMPGGEVTLRETPGGELQLRGPAREVFRGVWPLRSGSPS